MYTVFHVFEFCVFQMSVYLVDIGEYSVMMLSEIQPLAQQFRKLPFMAFNATLGSTSTVKISLKINERFTFDLCCCILIFYEI